MFYLTTYPAIRDSKMMFWSGNMFYNHIEIVCYLSEYTQNGRLGGCHEKFK